MHLQQCRLPNRTHCRQPGACKPMSKQAVAPRWRSSAPRGLGHAAAGHHPQLVPAVGVAICGGQVAGQQPIITMAHSVEGGRAAADTLQQRRALALSPSCPVSPAKTMSRSPPPSGLARLHQIQQILRPSAPLGSQWKRTQPGHVMMRCTMDPNVNSVAAAKPASAPARRWSGGAGAGKMHTCQSRLVAKWAGGQAGRQGVVQTFAPALLALHQRCVPFTPVSRLPASQRQPTHPSPG